MPNDALPWLAWSCDLKAGIRSCDFTCLCWPWSGRAGRSAELDTGGLQILAAAARRVGGRLQAWLPRRRASPVKHMRPLGILKLVLQSVELQQAENVFCVLKCAFQSPLARAVELAEPLCEPSCSGDAA